MSAGDDRSIEAGSGRRSRAHAGPAKRGRKATAAARRARGQNTSAGHGTDSNASAGHGRVGSGSGRRGRIGQALAGAAVVTAAGALLVGAVFAAESSALQPVSAPTTAVPAGDYVALCPAPPKLLEGVVTGGDEQFSPESETARSTLTALVLNGPSGTVAPGALFELGAPEATSALAEPAQTAAEAADPAVAASVPLRAAVLADVEVDTATVLRADALPTQTPPAAGVLAYTAQDGDLTGLAAANCRRPANDMWLLGANTTVGQTAVLTISNTSGTPATVDLELYGVEGPIKASGSRGILVAPGQSEEIVLAGLAADQPHLAVRLRSSGGPVSALIRQNVLRELTPGGVDYLAPSQRGTQQVMSGVVVQPQDVAGSISEQDGYAGAGPALQIAVPEGSDAVLEVRAFGSDGQKPLPADGVLTVPGGTVQEISLADLPADTYTVTVSSDVPVAASVLVSRGTEAGEPVDFAFSPSSDQLGNQHLVPVPDGLDTVLAFGAPAAEGTVTLRRVFADGQVSAPSPFTIAAGTTVTIPAEDIAGDGDGTTVGYVISASGGAIYGAQVLSTDEDRADISVLSLPEAAPGEQSLPIMLGY